MNTISAVIFLFLTLYIVSATQAVHKPVCNKVHCPFAPTPLGCPWGSVLKPNPSNPCCPCCVNKKTNKCEDPPDCSKVSCESIPTNPRCPDHSVLETKGCCPCCVSEKTGDCVSFLPPICLKKPCPNPLPPGRRCPDGSELNTTIDSSGCENCPCCVNATGQCVGNVPVIICPKFACIKPPDKTQKCPPSSSWTSMPPINGCPQCPCCFDQKTKQCVTPVPKKQGALPSDVDFEAICPKSPCPNPLPPGTMCPAGSTVDTTIDPQSGCENCPCCVNDAGDCVEPVPVICPKYACIKPPDPIKCPPKSSWQSKKNENGCSQCPCCLQHNTNQCVDPIPTACPLLLCIEPLPPGTKCPDDSPLDTTINPKTGCPECQCCVSTKSNKCVPPVMVDCPVYDCAPPQGNQCPNGASWVMRKDGNGCPSCPCCLDSNTNQCVSPISTESALSALQP